MSDVGGGGRGPLPDTGREGSRCVSGMHPLCSLHPARPAASQPLGDDVFEVGGVHPRPCPPPLLPVSPPPFLAPQVGVHIADVSYFVTPDNALDAEAARRATSVYLVQAGASMLEANAW